MANDSNDVLNRFQASKAVPAKRSAKTEALLKEATGMGIATKNRFVQDIRKEVTANKENIKAMDDYASSMMARKADGGGAAQRPAMALDGGSVVMPASSLESVPQAGSKSKPGGEMEGQWLLLDTCHLGMPAKVSLWAKGAPVPS